MNSSRKGQTESGAVAFDAQRLAAGQTVPVKIPAEDVCLDGDLTLPKRATRVVLFVHGSGSSRHSPRNQAVARTLQHSGTGTLLFDLLTREEERVDEVDAHLRFDISLLTRRLIVATRWLTSCSSLQHVRVGYFGSSTGGAAALVAAANLGEAIGAVVSRGGRPDLAGDVLPRVTAPTLLIVGERDDRVVSLNQEAYARLRCPKQLELVPDATHLFEEPGALDQVAALAAGWFQRYLGARSTDDALRKGE